MNQFLKNRFLVATVVVAVILLLSTSYYNSFVTQSNNIDGQWKQVEVQYQRRFDLIPNLVEATKGLMAQEQKVFGDIAAARAAYSGATTTTDRVRSAGQVETALARLLAIFENYPQIKSDQAVLKLQDELAGTENRISVERRRFNELVQNYNTSVTTVPAKLFAALFGFSVKPYFNTAVESKSPPKVQF